MADVFAEVDEMMRRERLEKIWREHGSFIIATIAAIIIGTGIVSGWRAWNESAETKNTAALIAALENTNPEAALQETAGDLRPGLRGIALLTAAGALVQQGKTEDALKVYERAAQDGSIPADLRDMAALTRIAMISAQTAPDEQQAKEFQKSLKKIWSNDSSPWRFHARLQSATLLAGNGAYSEAAALLEPALEVKDIAPSLAAKIRALHHVYTLKSAEAAPAEAENSQG